MKQKQALYFVILALLFATTSCSRSLHHERIFIPKKGPHRDESNIALAPRIPKRDTRLLIVIDAGHGGQDQGAESKGGTKLFEKNMALTTAHFLNNYLKGYGYHTLMTRTDDTFISLKDRSKFANEKKSNLFISVHYNGAESKKAEGIEVYYYKGGEDEARVVKSKLLAGKVLDSVIAQTQGKSRGVKHGDFSVIRETKMPAILVEGGFMTNDSEVSKIREAAYMKKIAWGIAEGIRLYLQKEGGA
jgi:N-acetylmuramoyl-L-alanine amidase